MLFCQSSFYLHVVSLIASGLSPLGHRNISLKAAHVSVYFWPCIRRWSETQESTNNESNTYICAVLVPRPSWGSCSWSCCCSAGSRFPSSCCRRAGSPAATRDKHDQTPRLTRSRTNELGGAASGRTCDLRFWAVGPLPSLLRPVSSLARMLMWQQCSYRVVLFPVLTRLRWMKTQSRNM